MTVDEVTDAASRLVLNVAVMSPSVGTPVAPDSGVRELTDGAPGGSTTMPESGVVGRAFMSVRTLTVACWMTLLGSPSSTPPMSRPRIHQFVPVETT
jgi:hypothetical protein